MRKLLSLLILLCCYAHAAFAKENVFSLNTYDFERGTTQTVYVHMDTPDPYGGFQFDLYLPEGVSIVTAPKPKIYADGPWGEDDVTLRCTKRANGSYRFEEYANDVVKSESGKGYIIEMKVETSSDAPTGPSKVEFKETILASTDAVSESIDLDAVSYDARVIAFFPVSATSADESKGSVELVGGGEKVESGTEVTVTAAPAAGYEFESWTSDGVEVSTENPYKFAVSQAVALVGNFKARKYDVTFVFDNGTDDYTQQLEYGSPITKPKDPVLAGHTFGGWIPAFEEGATVPVGGVTYTAVWTVNSYKLTYTVDGETYKEATVDFGTEITPEGAPVKEGYTFSGWDGVPETMPASDVTVSGKFTVNSYEAVFKINGEVLETKTVVYGEKVDTLAAPAKEGYTFSGWQGVPETMPARNIEIIGAYTVNTYKLTYEIDGKTYKEYEVEYGATITPEAAPEKEGYTFSGWEGVPETMPAKDVMVTGSFTVNSYKAVFKIGDEVIDTKTVNFGEKIAVPETPAKEGHTFSGWQDMPETMPAKDIEITGAYTANSYKLTYTVDGETYREGNVIYGTEIEAAAAPEKEGYTFSGWEGVPETMPAKDVVVTGSFTVNSYKAVFMIDGEVIDTKTVTYGEKIVTPEAPVKDGYTFSGWKSVPETMPARNIEIIGAYTVNTYKLTYEIDGKTYKEYEVEYGATITPEATPEEEGRTFSGWVGVPEMMPAKDVVVTGSFTVNSYQAVFVIGDEVIDTKTVTFGEKITTPDVPAKEGYTFSWQDVPETMPAKDIEITGVYTANSYKLTYTVDGETYKEETITYGTDIEEAAAPEKEGYTFSGWEGVPATMPANDVVVTGRFTVNSYDAVFKIGDEVIETKAINFGEPVAAPEAPAKEGHTFIGWEGVPETMPAKDIEITGVYTINQYKLTYTVDGETYKEENVTYGTEIEAAASPAKEGYTFSGWEGVPATMPAKDVVVTGSFTVNSYKAVFKIDGEVIDTKTITFGDKITTPEVPAKDGYTFSWQHVPATMPANDIEITGSYSVSQCVLTYLVDGEIYKEESVKIGADITPAPAPAKEGYTFSGWEGLPATMPDKDVTVNASFTVNQYRLSLYLNGELFYSEMVDYGYPITIDFVGVSDKFKFEGWQEEVPEFMPAHDVELHGTFTITSSISSVDMDDSTEVTVYNLSGQLLYKNAIWNEIKDKLESGVYIINGVKRRIVR